MTGASEQAFRDLLDERGLLRPGAMAPPDLSAGYAVFSQQALRLDVGALRAQGARFFDARVGLTVDKRYDEDVLEDAARVVVATNDGNITGTRLVYGRGVVASDLTVADAAEQAQKTHGLARLAERCRTLWIVRLESDATSDRAALLLAALFASLMLGPIVAPSGDEIFGVRSARTKLERAPGPYR